MNLKLWGSISRRCQRGYYRNLSGLQVKPRPGLDVSKGKLNKILREIRRNVLETFNYALSGFAINFSKLIPAALITFGHKTTSRSLCLTKSRHHLTSRRGSDPGLTD